jgi:hypothetical protein
MSPQKYEIVPVAEDPADAEPIALCGCRTGLALQIEIASGGVSR